ncbi:hypothetical protein A9G11_11135 [Gilliamella sp. wkB108]|uniref:DUF721 domain-containing protein n=1 Tax=Gilliamella sp. wkB108 TaxID=3120256 RepID=UPI00080E64F7|nr:DciA family protein [Gilliamella apicola]OCG28060.1 hypothetical protein A9G11_11135 [Gilliamella apicola]
MRYNEPQKLASILAKVSSLSKIQERTNALSKLSNVVSDLLPSPLNQQCRVANYRRGILVIEVSSASWLTRLRYEQSELISGIRRQILPSLSSIQYQINPNITAQLSQVDNQLLNKAKTPSIMTQKSAEFLYTLAENVPDKLKKQLIKLANHAK